MRPLPVVLPHETVLKTFGTLGYSTVRQAPNGMIQIFHDDASVFALPD